MNYTVYKVLNLVNKKYYIGFHQTNELNDNYMGSGKLIKKAIKKYGINNFRKEILFIFDNEADMKAKEQELVNECLVADHNTYNLVEGGKGGWGYVNRVGLNDRTGMVHGEESKKKMGHVPSNVEIKKRSQRMIGNTLYKKVDYTTRLRLPITEDHKKKISKALFNSVKKHNPRPRYDYSIQTPVGNLDKTSNLITYCTTRGLNYNYMKQGTKGYKIVTKIPLKNMRP